MNKKLILISGSPCVGKTAVGTRLFESYDNSAYLDGDWCWCVHPFSVADKRLRNGDRSMSFVLSNYLDSVQHAILEVQIDDQVRKLVFLLPGQVLFNEEDDVDV